MFPSSKTGITHLFSIHRLSRTVNQLLRFSIVGGLNTFIDLLAFNLLLWLLPTTHVHVLVLYNSLAYLLGAVNSFFWNKLWTFEHRSKVTSRQVKHFAIVTLAGIVCNDALIWLVTSALTAASLSESFWTNGAKVAAIAGTFAISYIGMRFGVFNGRNRGTKATPPRHQLLLMTPRSLSVILPAYNEEAVIEQTLCTIMPVLAGWMHNFEVLVINDGSRDHTAEIVARLSAYDARIKLLNHPVNKGYGAALVTGFESATKETTFFMDSDGQFDIRDLVAFFPLLEQYDAVLGYRIDRQDAWMRKLNAWTWKHLVHFIFGVSVRDVDCAFKLYRSEFFRRYRLETRSAMINAEVLYKLGRYGYTYTEVGVRHLPRQAGMATGAKPAVIVRALREMLVFARKWHTEESYEEG